MSDHLAEIEARWEPVVLKGEFTLRDGSRTDTYVERPTITSKPKPGLRSVSREQTYDDIDWLVARLRAVLDLHWRLVSGPDEGFCNGCDHSWPCPTVLRVRDEAVRDRG